MDKSIGTILKIKEDGAILFTNDKEFVKIRKRPGMFIGQTVEFSKSDMNKPSKNQFMRYLPALSGIAAVFIFVLFMYFNIWTSNIPKSVYAYVDVDINPSLELMIDYQSKVVKIRSLNDDSKILLKKTSLNGLLLYDAIKELINKSEENGFIKNDKSNFVLVSASLNDKGKEYIHDKDGEEKRLSEILEPVAKLEVKSSYGSIIETRVLLTSPEIRESAVKNNVSSGRQTLAVKAREAGISMSADEIKTAPISVIMGKIKGIDEEIFQEDVRIGKDTIDPHSTIHDDSTESVTVTGDEEAVIIPLQEETIETSKEEKTVLPGYETEPSQSKLPPAITHNPGLKPVLSPEPKPTPTLKPVLSPEPKPIPTLKPEPTPTPKPAQTVLPKLLLKVSIVDANEYNTDSAQQKKPNVVMKAVCVYPDNAGVVTNAGVVDFYLCSTDVGLNNSNANAGFIYLDSAELDRNGNATIMISQKPGEYVALAICSKNPWGKKISSTPVRYTIKMPAATDAKPVLAPTTTPGPALVPSSTTKPVTNTMTNIAP